ncbi:MAG: replicative DNA helicase, partial [Abditibacteriota bacterium]|nr:replicative DNA helicase [Abditibacteriota bacterium]
MAARDPRVLPQNIEAEQAILGSMLVSTAACETAVEILEDSDFYRKEHRIIFDVLKSMIVRDVPIDTITVQEELRKRGELEQVGALDYLLTLVDSVALGDNVEYYADIVADKSTLRKLITAGTEIVAMAYDQEEEVRDIPETPEIL